MVCIYCRDSGRFRDDLSGGESYCTCPAGERLKQAERANARKPSNAEVLATTLPGGPFDGWYCPNHPPGEALANRRAEAHCWGCGEPRPHNTDHPDCWCGPTIETVEGGAKLITHRVLN